MSLKKILTAAVLLLTLISVQKAKAQTELKGLPKGAMTAASSGFSMTAKINGKPVKAHATMPAEEAGQIVGFYDGDRYIGLPYDKINMVAGKKIKFSDENADLTTNDKVQVWNGRKGEMEITKVSGHWVEGKFFFTGYSYDNTKTIAVTDGFFRIQLK